MPLLGLLTLWACQEGPAIPDHGDRQGLVDALNLVSDDPMAAMSRCRDLSDTVRGECVVAVVEGAPKLPDAAAWCDEIDGLAKDECHFQRAERSGQLDACASAGAFADDCRLHLWSRQAGKHVGASLPETVASTRAGLIEAGIDPADLRFWSASFRAALLASQPYDRAACRTIDDATLQDVCLRTGIAVWHDLLNHERDFGAPPCDGRPLPPRLEHAEDPDLDGILADRLASDLCGPRR